MVKKQLIKVNKRLTQAYNQESRALATEYAPVDFVPIIEQRLYNSAKSGLILPQNHVGRAWSARLEACPQIAHTIRGQNETAGPVLSHAPNFRRDGGNPEYCC